MALAPTTDDPPLSPEERDRVAAIVEAVRPDFRADGGDVAFVDVVGGTVRVRLEGVCADCGAAVFSLAGLQRRMSHELGRRVRVRPLPRASGAPS